MHSAGRSVDDMADSGGFCCVDRAASAGQHGDPTLRVLDQQQSVAAGKGRRERSRYRRNRRNVRLRLWVRALSSAVRITRDEDQILRGAARPSINCVALRPNCPDAPETTSCIRRSAMANRMSRSGASHASLTLAPHPHPPLGESRHEIDARVPAGDADDACPPARPKPVRARRQKASPFAAMSTVSIPARPRPRREPAASDGPAVIDGEVGAILVAGLGVPPSPIRRAASASPAPAATDPARNWRLLILMAGSAPDRPRSLPARRR